MSLPNQASLPNLLLPFPKNKLLLHRTFRYNLAFETSFEKLKCWA